MPSNCSTHYNTCIPYGNSINQNFYVWMPQLSLNQIAPNYLYNWIAAQICCFQYICPLHSLECIFDWVNSLHFNSFLMVPRSHSNVLIQDTSEVKPIRDSVIFWYMHRGALWGTNQHIWDVVSIKFKNCLFFFQKNFNISLTIQNILHHWFAICSVQEPISEQISFH